MIYVCIHIYIYLYIHIFTQGNGKWYVPLYISYEFWRVPWCYIFVSPRRQRSRREQRDSAPSGILGHRTCPLDPLDPVDALDALGIEIQVLPWETAWNCQIMRKLGCSGKTGRWFGTFLIFSYIGNNHPNWLIFFRGDQTTNQWVNGMRMAQSLIRMIFFVTLTVMSLEW